MHCGVVFIFFHKIEHKELPIQSSHYYLFKHIQVHANKLTNH